MAAGDLSWDAERDGLCALPIRPLRDIPWERSDDHVTIHLGDRDVHFRLRVIPVLEGLAKDTDLPTLVEALRAREPDRNPIAAARSARFLVSGLALHGFVEVRLPPLPRVLDERYEMEQELGRGGVGVVWSARDRERTGERVVVKHAWNWTGPLAKREETIRHEARLMARLDHPGVVRAIDLVEHEGRAHLVRSYVEGRELGQLLLGRDPPGAETRREWTRQAAEILAHLHDRGVLCLDVKPANFMRRDDGGLVLSDLSHCRAMEGDRLELAGALGTRNFMAPEVARGRVASPASDVYGLGRFHAALVLGREPSTGDAAGALLDKLAAAGATGEEMALVEDCCAEETADRPQSAAAVADRLNG